MPVSGNRSGCGLPEQRQQVVEHAERRAAARRRRARAPSRRGSRAPSPRPIVMPGDQVVEHELVQDDDARPLARARRRSSRARRGRCRRGRASTSAAGAPLARLARRRPPRPARAAPAAAAPSSRRSRSATAAAASSRRPSRRAARRCSASQVTRSATAFPARPQALASSAWPRGRRTPGDRAPARARRRRPVSRSWTISSGPPASVVVTTGFSDRNASNGTIP